MDLTLDELRIVRLALHQRVDRLYELADECRMSSDLTHEQNEKRNKMRLAYRREAIDVQSVADKVHYEITTRVNELEVMP